MPFEMPEYVTAYRQFLNDAYEGFLKADPLLGQIQAAPTTGTLDSGYITPEGDMTTNEATAVQVTHEVTWDAVIDSDVDSLTASIAEGATHYIDQMHKALIDLMKKTTEQTGNVVNAKGMDKWDAIMEGLDKVEWSPDATGTLRPPGTLLMSPSMRDKLGAPPPETEAKMAAIAARKQEEFDARRRRRRLS